MTALVKSGKVPQALLFAGPKGTGKTSTARILGALLNDPLNEKAVDAHYFGKGKAATALQDLKEVSKFAEKILSGDSFVVQEMDAASNRGIDDVRALKERIMLPPQEGRMSVYILDEAHMLTTEAFNALLKILEEPPQHVVFIFATTEMHKIPDTIVSRCHVINFRKANKDEILAALEPLVKAEKIKYEAEALEFIADRADGSFRDAIKLLEVASQDGKITSESLESFAVSLNQELTTLVEAVIGKDPQAVVKLFNDLRQNNVDEKYFYKRLLGLLHRDLQTHLGLHEGDTFTSKSAAQFLLAELLTESLQFSSPIPHLPLELKLLEIIDRAQKNGQSASTGKKKAQIAPNHEKVTVIAEPIAVPTHKEPLPEPVTLEKTEFVPAGPAGDGSKLVENWNDYVDKVAAQNSTIAALLRSAQPIAAEGDNVSIGVYYLFHQEQLSNQKFSQMTQNVASEMCGGNVKMSIVLTEPPTAAELADAKDIELNESAALAQVATEALM